MTPSLPEKQAASEQCLVLTAPAKVNFGLRVVGLRADGYHSLESLFLPLDFTDEISLEQLPQESGAGRKVEFQLVGGGEEVPSGPANLVARAAQLFLEQGNLEASLRIRLHKRLPSGAGLGGGSSDAATVLRALEQRFPGIHSSQSLLDLAITLGADVPFFLSPQPAWVSGIGEQIQELAEIPSFALLLANPGTPLSTPQVFKRFDERDSALTPWESGSTMRSVFEFRERPRGEDLQRLLQNDLEPAALDLCPELAKLRLVLSAAGAMAVSMSGSGATLYGVFEDVTAAERARKSDELSAVCAAPGWSQVVCTLPSRS